MFKSADWTQPQIGGLLSEIIEKEEQQLRAPKPRIRVQHVWDPNDLAHRSSDWKVIPQRPVRGHGDFLGLSKSRQEDKVVRNSRSAMIQSRRTRDTLDALQRQRELDSRLGADSSPGLSMLTPAEYQKLRPSYTATDNFATQTTSQLIGMGSKMIPMVPSRYARTNSAPDPPVSSRNGSDRLQNARSQQETYAFNRPATVTTLYEQLQSRAAEKHVHLFGLGRDPRTAYCRRPGEMPIS